MPAGTEGTSMIDPASGLEFFVVAMGDVPTNFVGLNSLQCLLGVAGWEVFRKRGRLLSIEDVHSLLASLATYFPAIARAVSVSVPPAELIQALRLVRAERHTLQDLRSIFTAMLDAFPASGPHAAGAYADAAIAAAQELMLDPHGWQGELGVVRPAPELEARLAEGHVLPAREQEHVREAAWSLLETFPRDTGLVFLTSSAARRPLRAIVSPEFPAANVLSEDQVPLGRATTVLGTISERETVV
jgi:flagellar biosynthesis component FlhA